MAKRKRLTPAQPDYLESQKAPETKAMPMGSLGPAPIAQVAGDASARAALDELGTALQTARADGRIIELLPISEVDEGYLVRDRMEQDEDEMGALMDSLRARGQQTAVEVIRLPDPKGELIYGLISGWRRLTALRRLFSETGDQQFATIRARIVSPETAQAAYVAMVEENEIRVNLSLYERARITVQAMREGVYPSQRVALQGLFGSTTRSKRSKIGTFIAVVEALDADLKYPTAIPEKLGLALAREILRTPVFVSDVRARLKAFPKRTSREELHLLAAEIEARYPSDPVAESAPAPAEVTTQHPKKPPSRPSAKPSVREYAAVGVSLSFYPGKGKIEMTGPNVDGDLYAALKAWLGARPRNES